MDRLEIIYNVIKCILSKGLPLFSTLRILYNAKREKNISPLLAVTTNWLEKPNEYMPFEDYIDASLQLNDSSLLEALDAKAVLFRRMPNLLKRDYLEVENVSEKDILLFVNRHTKVIGKRNLYCGKGCVVYKNTDKNLIAKIKSNNTDILEEMIIQHPEYAAMNSSSVNTLRIHTMRTSKWCGVVLFPLLRVGIAGQFMDIGTKDNDPYNILLDHEGHIIGSFRVGENGIKPCAGHEDSNYIFTHGKQLPFIKEAEELCVEAASKIPEAKYIGWDVAITEEGPSIVEGNGISGTPSPYQVIHYFCFGYGNADEVKNMLKQGMEDINYDGGFISLIFADLKYLWESDATPDTVQQFLLLLQNALHNHGVNFFSSEQLKERIPNCEITYNTMTRSVHLKTQEHKIRVVPLPSEIPSNIFEADVLAHTLAQKIYYELLDMNHTLAQKNCYELLDMN